MLCIFKLCFLLHNVRLYDTPIFTDPKVSLNILVYRCNRISQNFSFFIYVSGRGGLLPLTPNTPKIRRRYGPVRKKKLLSYQPIWLRFVVAQL